MVKKFIIRCGFEPYLCQSEQEARELVATMPDVGKWPWFFSPCDTAREEDFEEFFINKDKSELRKFNRCTVIKNKRASEFDKLDFFVRKVIDMKKSRDRTKEQIIELFFQMTPEFGNKKTGKYLDSKM